MNERTKYALTYAVTSFVILVALLVGVYGIGWLILCSPIWLLFVAGVAAVFGLYFWSGLNDYDRKRR